MVFPVFLGRSTVLVPWRVVLQAGAIWAPLMPPTVGSEHMFGSTLCLFSPRSQKSLLVLVALELHVQYKKWADFFFDNF